MTPPSYSYGDTSLNPQTPTDTSSKAKELNQMRSTALIGTAFVLISFIAPAWAGCPQQMWQCSAEMMEKYDSLDQTDRAVLLKFPVIGRIVVTPRIVDEYHNFRCTAEVRDGRSKFVLDTIGGKFRGSGRCGATSSVGRVPSPTDVYRVAIIHIATAPGILDTLKGELTPVILSRTRSDPRWRVDKALGQRLIAAGATDTIADIRRYLKTTGQ